MKTEDVVESAADRLSRMRLRDDIGRDLNSDDQEWLLDVAEAALKYISLSRPYRSYDVTRNALIEALGLPYENPLEPPVRERTP